MSSEKEEAASSIPQLGVRFLSDSNSWIVNRTQKLRTMRQMLRALSQQASDYVLAQHTFFSWVFTL